MVLCFNFCFLLLGTVMVFTFSFLYNPSGAFLYIWMESIINLQQRVLPLSLLQLWDALVFSSEHNKDTLPFLWMFDLFIKIAAREKYKLPFQRLAGFRYLTFQCKPGRFCCETEPAVIYHKRSTLTLNISIKKNAFLLGFLNVFILYSLNGSPSSVILAI